MEANIDTHDALIDRLSTVETTLKVGLGVGSAFILLLLGIGTWYVQSRDDSISRMADNLNEMTNSLTRLSVSMEFYAISLSSHVTNDEEHLNNGSRVDQNAKDLTELKAELREYVRSNVPNAVAPR